MHIPLNYIGLCFYTSTFCMSVVIWYVNVCVCLWCGCMIYDCLRACLSVCHYLLRCCFFVFGSLSRVKSHTHTLAPLTHSHRMKSNHVPHLNPVYARFLLINIVLYVYVLISIGISEYFLHSDSANNTNNNTNNNHSNDNASVYNDESFRSADIFVYVSFWLCCTLFVITGYYLQRKVKLRYRNYSRRNQEVSLFNITILCTYVCMYVCMYV